MGSVTGRKAWQAHKYADQFSGGEKKNFQSGESGFSESYRELVSEEMPAVFVLIDRFSGILESNQDYKDVFVRLFSEGPSKGIYFVLYRCK